MKEDKIGTIKNRKINNYLYPSQIWWQQVVNTIRNEFKELINKIIRCLQTVTNYFNSVGQRCC